MTLSAGTRLRPYEILRAIGSGGMGEVFEREARATRRAARSRLVLVDSGPD